MKVNPVTENLPAYPMEELSKIKAKLLAAGKTVYDFGTGDPQIPIWKPIKESMLNAVRDVSNYPSVSGSAPLIKAITGYLERRFTFKMTPDSMILPTNGSKEAIFHIALSLVDPQSPKRYVIYPNPGYPVYKASVQFAGGIPLPLDLKEEHDYLMQPWDLPEQIQKNTVAIWINYPHNPTGKPATKEYLLKLAKWSQAYDVIILSDDCYIDIYSTHLDDDKSGDKLPLSFLDLGVKNAISFFSLSKRSGLTGYRSGFMIGDHTLLEKTKKARANFGVATPDFIQAAAITAWNDDNHVKERRKIFTDRIDAAFPVFKNLGMIEQSVETTFYLWCNVPKAWNGDDIKFTMDLAELGVICSPSTWLSENIGGYVRFALVPEMDDMMKALGLIEKMVGGRR